MWIILTEKPENSKLNPSLKNKPIPNLNANPIINNKDVLRAHGSNKKNFLFRLWASDKPTPVP